MKTFHGDLSSLTPLATPVALTVGNFDGVHRGHQYLVESLLKQARQISAEPALLCFNPHPELVIGKDDFQQLMTFEDKQTELAKLGIQFLVVQDFSTAFATIDPEVFLRQYLLHFFNLSFLLVGYDFRFGQSGRGDFSMIEAVMKEYSIPTQRECPLQEQEQVISSSLIRQCLQAGEVEQAKQYLGRPYKVSGVVAAGQALGRTLGFPTANLEKIETLVPGQGVYACWIEVDSSQFSAVVNIGLRPTVKGASQTVEAHILDFSRDIYGEKVSLKFLKKIRNEKKFANLDLLKQQIHNDIISARAFFDSEDQ